MWLYLPYNPTLACARSKGGYVGSVWVLDQTGRRGLDFIRDCEKGCEGQYARRFGEVRLLASSH